MEQGDHQDSKEQRKLFDVERRMLLKRISGMENLPAPHPSVLKIISLFREDEVDVDQIVKAIEKDQTLVAQLLKMVNASFYGLRHTIDSVGKAVTLLGLENVKLLVCSSATMEFFSAEEKLEWEHSYSTSLLMANLIKENELPGLSTLPLAMILHDIGRVVLRRSCPQKYKIVEMLTVKDNIPLFQAELENLHVCHAEAGALLLEKWNSVEGVVMPILQHHMVDTPTEYVFETALVQFVNWVDCRVRRIPCTPPSLSLMDAAGIEDIDNDYWLNYQTRLLNMLKYGGTQMRDLGNSSGRLHARHPAIEGMEKTRRIGKPLQRQDMPYSSVEMGIIEKNFKADTHPEWHRRRTGSR